MDKQHQVFFEKPELLKPVHLYFVFCFRQASDITEGREVVLDASSVASTFPNTLHQVFSQFPRFLHKLQKLELPYNHFCAIKQIVVEKQDPRVRVESYVMGYFEELVPKNV